jgi:hypothetical protein
MIHPVMAHLRKRGKARNPLHKALRVIPRDSGDMIFNYW